MLIIQPKPTHSGLKGMLPSTSSTLNLPESLEQESAGKWQVQLSDK